VAVLATAAEGGDELRRPADGRPDAEDREDVRDASGRGDRQGDRGDGAGRGVAEQEAARGPALAARVSLRVGR
jgi:hypothetical protein